ncbi:MATE efflux family protein (macronuclear) [Tetrahymena thermophila SB210]|uniref:MATE efflux family protein n=1 Tax=Tetrahymena thermophila (strain SB210) TaxID=312017 RepID=I7ML25_TETTS|nr:MATE efflux family protein [Tetrahymena thermophila SB210]EAS01037.1 MATE efflux family protein [Tetrahymena thermophila SB210]|eukprot:XP_001021282.1 MATE efflux family protein [Tetrahymena thermophila SB210]
MGEGGSSGDIEALEVYDPKEVLLTKDLFQMSRDEQKSEIWKVANSAISVGIGILLSILFLSVNLHFAGLLQNDAILGGIGLGNIMINCTGYFLLVGLNQGFGSLSARAFSAKSSILMKNYFTKGAFTVLCVSIFMLVFMFNVYDILVALGQEEQVSYYASQYSLGIMFGLICLFFFDFLRNYFNSMGIYNEPMYIQIVSIVTQYLFCFVFSEYLGYGFSGIIFATNINYFFLLLMAIWLAKKKNLDIMPECKMDTVKVNYKKYIHFCMPIALPMVVDIFCFELNSLLIGSMQIKAQFNAHIIMCNLASLFYSFPLGLCGALCTLISNAVGHNDHVKAKNYFKISYIVGIGFACVSTFLFVFYKRELGLFYTSDEEIVQQFVSIMTIFQFFIGLDYLQGSQQGILKGVGLGKVCLMLFIICFYVIGTTSSCILGFVFDLQLIGFWIGFVLAIVTVFASQTYVMLKINWQEQIHEQHEHLLQDKKLLDELQTELIKSEH